MKTIGIVLQGMRIGGCERAVSYISLVLRKHYNVKIIVFDDNDIAFSYGGELISLNQPSKRGAVNKVINSIKRIKKLKRIVKQNNIEILYIFLNPTNVLNFYKPRKCKKFVSCRGFGDLLSGEKFNLYGIMTYLSDGIIFNSQKMQEYFVDKYPLMAIKSHVVSNFFDFNLIQNQSLEELSSEHKNFIDSHRTIISVGRVCKEKNFFNLVKSFEKVKIQVNDAGLLIVGDGELFDELKQVVNSSHYKDDILLVGYQKNPYKYMKNSAVFALSSVNEGFPNVLIEAMGCGLPVVASDCESGPSEILYEEYISNRKIDGVTFADYGIIVPVIKECSSDLTLDNTCEMFANALENLLLNKEISEQYSKMSYERASMFDYKTNYASLVNILESNLGGNNNVNI